MLRTFLAALLGAALLLRAVPASAGADQDEIARAMIQAAGQSALRELEYEAGRRLVDLGLQAAAVPATQFTGAEAVAWARLGFAANDFVHAKNDKGRVMSGMDVGVAVTAIACPPCGVTAGVAVLVVKLVDLGLSTSHGKKMLELQKQIMAANLETLRLKRQRAARENADLLYVVGGLQASRQRVEQSSEELRKQCGTLADGLPIAQLEGCTRAFSAALPAIADYLAYSEQLAVTSSEFFSENHVGENGKSFRDYRAYVAELKQRFRETKAQAREAFAQATKLLARAAVEQARAQGSLDLLEQQRQRCYDEALGFVRESNLSLLKATASVDVNTRARVGQLYYSGRSSFDDAGCRELLVAAPDRVDPLVEMLAARERTLQRLEKFLQLATELPEIP